MAAFIQDLWSSIFTPGPTSTLLLATNVSFAALQSVLLALLIATYSIHFVILSVLCAGLWAAINWFAKEVMIAQAQQEERKTKDADGQGLLKSTGSVKEVGGREEVEVIEPVELPADSIQLRQTRSAARTDKEDISGTSSATDAGQGAWNTGAAARLAPSRSQVLQQRRAMSESIGELSTDGEWEKIEDEGR